MFICIGINVFVSTSNERKVCVIVRARVHKVAHGALPLYVTPSLENSPVRLVSRWKTYEDVGAYQMSHTRVLQGTPLFERKQQNTVCSIKYGTLTSSNSA